MKGLEEEEKPRRSRVGSVSYLWWVAAAVAGFYFLSRSGLVMPSILMGPTVLPDPLTSVQAGGTGSSVQSLAVMSMMGPYANG